MLKDTEPVLTYEDPSEHPLADKARSSFNKLGEACRKLLEGFYMHGASMKSLAEDLGYSSTESAKAQKYKCLQQVRKLMAS